MAIKAELINGKSPDLGAEPPMVEEGQSGYRGTRFYRVNTLDEYEALNAIGMPQVKPVPHPWSASWPNLVVVNRRTRVVGGVPLGDGTLEGGNTVVEVTYETPGLNGRLPAPEENLVYTELDVAVSTYQLAFDQRLVNPSRDYVVPANVPLVASTAPINGGRGLAVPRGTVQARVVHYLSERPSDIRSRLVRLATYQGLNLGQVKLPRINQSTADWVLEPGQVQYVGFVEQVDRGVRRLIHTLNLAENFVYEWLPEDSNGNASQEDPVPVVVFPAFDFSGLWPGA